MKTLVAAGGLVLLLVSPACATDSIGETARSFSDYCQGGERMALCGRIISNTYSALVYGAAVPNADEKAAEKVTGCIPESVSMSDIAIVVIGSLRVPQNAARPDDPLAVFVSDALVQQYPCN